MSTSATATDIRHRLVSVKSGALPLRHPVNQVQFEDASLGEHLADAIAAGIGSWRFLIVQTIAVAAWVALNLVGFVNHWDPFPFILLNLLFSVQAAYTGPVLLLAGNRQAQKDRLTLEHAATEADKGDRQNTEILTKIAENTELTVQILQHLEQQREELIARMEASGVLKPQPAHGPTDSGTSAVSSKVSKATRPRSEPIHRVDDGAEPLPELPGADETGASAGSDRSEASPQ